MLIQQLKVRRERVAEVQVSKYRLANCLFVRIGLGKLPCDHPMYIKKGESQSVILTSDYYHSPSSEVISGSRVNCNFPRVEKDGKGAKGVKRGEREGPESLKFGKIRNRINRHNNGTNFPQHSYSHLAVCFKANKDEIYYVTYVKTFPDSQKQNFKFTLQH